jgi:hypothetical protein
MSINTSLRAQFAVTVALIVSNASVLWYTTDVAALACLAVATVATALLAVLSLFPLATQKTHATLAEKKPDESYTGPPACVPWQHR